MVTRFLADYRSGNGGVKNVDGKRWERRGTEGKIRRFRQRLSSDQGDPQFFGAAGDGEFDAVAFLFSDELLAER